MWKKVFAAIAVTVVFIIVGTASVVADGGLIGKGGRDIYEPEQKAVIFYHQGQEELILSVRYEGAAEEFAWLVPFPEPPEIEESEFIIFELMSAIAPSEMIRNRGAAGTEMMDGQHLGVEVIEERTVGAYDLTVVRASDAGDLKSWLGERGFAYDADVEKVLKDYIGRGWCFVAMRINQSEVDDAGWMLSEGTIDPLRFSFNAPQPVYPLYISSLNPGGSEVLIYVLGDEAYHHPDLEVEFADGWQGIQVGLLKQFSDLAEEMEREGGCAVTKMRGFFEPQDMHDLYLVPADNETLEAWTAGLTSTGVDSENTFPVWAIPVIIILLAGLATVISELVHSGPAGSPWRVMLVFLISSLVLTGIVLPLWLRSGSTGGDASVSGADWPWEDDILFTHNGWEKVLHPDGSYEVTGTSDYIHYIISQPADDMDMFYDPFSWTALDYEGEWSWRDSNRGEWNTRDRCIELKKSDGEEMSVCVGAKNQIIDARLSPEGERLWVVMDPGYPENSTEVHEYVFPSITLVRSLIHDNYLRKSMMGDNITLSDEGEPLLAGYFCQEMDVHIGLLPMLEENAGFIGESIDIYWEDVQDDQDHQLSGILNSDFCDARDGSPFLLISEFDYEYGENTVCVFDTRDGGLYKVARGTAMEWDQNGASL